MQRREEGARKRVQKSGRGKRKSHRWTSLVSEGRKSETKKRNTRSSRETRLQNHGGIRGEEKEKKERCLPQERGQVSIKGRISALHTLALEGERAEAEEEVGGGEEKTNSRTLGDILRSEKKKIRLRERGGRDR